MALSKFQPIITVDEYLAMERSAEERHEFIDGHVYAMAGESSEHADITVNLVSTVVQQLKGTGCRARSKDTKVRSGPAPKQKQSRSGLFSYPDLVVICGDPKYHDEFTDVVLNPAVIMEVLSPSTEAFDRGEKFRRFQLWNETLTDYILISQHLPQIEQFVRESDGNWSFHRAEGQDSKIVIASIRCTLSLADVFDRISFPENQD